MTGPFWSKFCLIIWQTIYSGFLYTDGLSDQTNMGSVFDRLNKALREAGPLVGWGESDFVREFPGNEYENNPDDTGKYRARHHGQQCLEFV